ncbi:IPT/TIG domain-containing protein [Pontibacter beigongshangensis]|uniref:IPT/TIG domain-containing protein n=1 Tax=Pontibacter beigongshangensis TaxID=2574733 RepID=UPI001F504DAA|nr:IPT/TIG domain-containing protein [Pontibacter beigongshangensis]
MTNMVITVPANFEIWRPNAGVWDVTRTLIPNAQGSIASTSIIVRYNPAAVGSHGGNITHVANNGDVIATLSVSGTAEAALSVTSVSPGSSRIGQTIVITGTRLNAGTAGTQVTFNDVNGQPVVAEITSLSATSMNVVVPVTAASGTITVTTSEDVVAWENFIVLRPEIILSGTLVPFETNAGVASAPQQYTLSGVNLVEGVSVTAPTNFQVSLTETEGYVSLLEVPLTNETDGSLAATTVYVRYLPAAQGTDNGSINHVSEGASASLEVSGVAGAPIAVTRISPTSSRKGLTVTLTGTGLDAGTPIVTFAGDAVATIVSSSATEIKVTVPDEAQSGPIAVTVGGTTVYSPEFTRLFPVVSASQTTLSVFTAEATQTSAPQSYTVSGTNLSQRIMITAPEHFQIARAEAGPYSSTIGIGIDIGNGVATATTIFVRYAPQAEGEHTGFIINESSGDTLRIAVQGTAAPLPVELVSFTAEQKGAATLLKWVTASETDNSHFEVEMSASPETGFTTVGTVKSKVVNSSITTRYEYTHQVRNAGTYYYRLKQVDLDGTHAYSNVIVVASKGVAANAVTVAPNPLIPDSKIIVEAASSGKAIMRLTSMTGQQVYFREVEVTAGPNEFALPYYDKLQSAAYILTVELNGKVISTKVVKQ